MRLPPPRYFLYVLGTVNVIMAVVLVLAALIFSGGVNVFSVAVVALIVNLVSAVTVAHQFGRSH